MGPIKVSCVRTIENVHRKYDITGIIFSPNFSELFKFVNLIPELPGMKLLCTWMVNHDTRKEVNAW